MAQYGERVATINERPIDVNANGFDFPAEAATVLLEALNYGIYKEALTNPERIVKDAPRGGKVPVGYQPRPLDEWLANLAKVHAAQGLQVIGEEGIARDPEGSVLLGGFFGRKSNEGDFGIAEGSWIADPKTVWKRHFPPRCCRTARRCAH